MSQKMSPAPLEPPVYWQSPSAFLARRLGTTVCPGRGSVLLPQNHIAESKVRICSSQPDPSVRWWGVWPPTPPAQYPYNQLKEQLKKRTTTSEEHKLQLLFYRWRAWWRSDVNWTVRSRYHICHGEYRLARAERA